MPEKHPLRALASATAPAWKEGDSVPLSVDLNGTLRSTAGVGGGGGLAGDVTIHDQGTPTRFLAISAGGAASVAVSGTVPVSGPLTDTQLRASAVPVSNTSLPLPAGASTEATLALIKAKTDNLDVFLSTRTKPADTQKVDGSAVTQPVSGIFWQATQPISAASLPLPASAAQDRTTAAAPAAVRLSDGAAFFKPTTPADTQPVSGIFWQATQPVSGTTTANQGTANATPWNENLAQVGGAAITQGQKTMAASVPVVIASDQTVLSTKAVQAVTYTAIYRLAARPYALSNAFAAAGRKQYATIHHAATAAKLVKVKRVEVALESSSVAAIVMADLVRLTNATTPATGNPAVTPTPQNPGDAGSEATCLSLPTTAGTEGAIHSFLEWNLGITGAASVVNPPPALNWYTLWPQVQGAGEVPENKYPTIRNGVLEGFAVTLDCNAISTVKGFVVIEFSEE